jgi:hypothetical protein
MKLLLVSYQHSTYQHRTFEDGIQKANLQVSCAFYANNVVVYLKSDNTVIDSAILTNSQM